MKKGLSAGICKTLCLAGFSVFAVFLCGLLQDAGEALSPAFMGLSVGSLIVIAACAASSGCRVPAGKMCRSVDLHRALLPSGESGAAFSERVPTGVFPRRLAQKKRRQSFVESVPYAQSEKAQVEPLCAFATPGDSAMLESCPFRLPVNREAIRLRRCPIGSNTQVPANWAFLRILAQGPYFETNDCGRLRRAASCC